MCLYIRIRLHIQMYISHKKYQNLGTHEVGVQSLAFDHDCVAMFLQVPPPITDLSTRRWKWLSGDQYLAFASPNNWCPYEESETLKYAKRIEILGVPSFETTSTVRWTGEKKNARLTQTRLTLDLKEPLTSRQNVQRYYRHNIWLCMWCVCMYAYIYMIWYYIIYTYYSPIYHDTTLYSSILFHWIEQEPLFRALKKRGVDLFQLVLESQKMATRGRVTSQTASGKSDHQLLWNCGLRPVAGWATKKWLFNDLKIEPVHTTVYIMSM